MLVHGRQRNMSRLNFLFLLTAPGTVLVMSRSSSVPSPAHSTFQHYISTSQDLQYLHTGDHRHMYKKLLRVMYTYCTVLTRVYFNKLMGINNKYDSWFISINFPLQHLKSPFILLTLSHYTKLILYSVHSALPTSSS